jgi:hypothetical protein
MLIIRVLTFVYPSRVYWFPLSRSRAPPFPVSYASGLSRILTRPTAFDRSWHSHTRRFEYEDEYLQEQEEKREAREVAMAEAMVAGKSLAELGTVAAVLNLFSE